jgi:hypothetical protein
VALQIDLPAGKYSAEWTDPVKCSVAGREKFTHAGGVRELPAPPFSEDMALLVRRIGR